jgi:hypothetical protein
MLELLGAHNIPLGLLMKMMPKQVVVLVHSPTVPR